MRFSSRAAWSFWASLACLDVIDAADMLEIDLLFPRDNETYAPTELMPIVFGLRNAELGQYLQPELDVGVHNSTSSFYNHWGVELASTKALTWANWSSHEPYFASIFAPGFTTETTWTLYWTVSWTSCKADGDGVFRGHTKRNESTGFVIKFTIKNGGQAVDLAAATANGKACASDGFAIGVTDKFVNVTNLLGLGEGPNLETCVAMASSTPTPTADPCRVTIDSTAAASISAELSLASCYALHSPTECPSRRKSAGPRLAVAGTVCMAAALWAFAFLLA